MAFPVATRSTGLLVTAAIWNGDLVDNINAIINSSGNLAIASAGPHALGTAVDPNAILKVGGSFSPSTVGAGAWIAPTILAKSNENAYGLAVAPTLVEAGVGEHFLLTSAIFSAPIVTASAASVGIAATVYVDGVPAASAGLATALYIETGSADGIHVALSNALVAHGMTDGAPTSVYGCLSKASATAGGMAVRGLSEDVIGLDLKGNGTAEDIVTTSAAQGAINVNASKKSGTGFTPYGTTANLFVVRNEGGGARLIVKGDGTIWADGTYNTYFAAPNGERYDDAMLCLAWESTLNQDPRLLEIQQTRGQYFTEDLVAAGILAEQDHATGRHFMNLTAMAKLSLGAAWQTALELRALRDRVAELEDQLHG